MPLRLIVAYLLIAALVAAALFWLVPMLRAQAYKRRTGYDRPSRRAARRARHDGDQ